MLKNAKGGRVKNRENKYRAFYKSEKRWIDIFSLHCDDGHILSVEDVTGLRLNISDINLVQYTGLKDQDGQEIFEGDILKHITDENITIKKVVYDAQHGAFIMKCDKYFAELRATYGDGDMYADTYLIIGNIYENPEILKQI